MSYAALSTTDVIGMCTRTIHKIETKKREMKKEICDKVRKSFFYNPFFYFGTKFPVTDDEIWKTLDWRSKMGCDLYCARSMSEAEDLLALAEKAYAEGQDTVFVSADDLHWVR